MTLRCLGGHFSILLAVLRGGLRISSSLMGSQLYGELPPDSQNHVSHAFHALFTNPIRSPSDDRPMYVSVHWTSDRSTIARISGHFVVSGGG